VQLLGACPHQGMKEWDFPNHVTLSLFILMSGAMTLQRLLPQVLQEAHLDHPRGPPGHLTHTPPTPAAIHHGFRRAPGTRPERGEAGVGARVGPLLRGHFLGCYWYQ